MISFCMDKIHCKILCMEKIYLLLANQSYSCFRLLVSGSAKDRTVPSIPQRHEIFERSREKIHFKQNYSAPLTHVKSTRCCANKLQED